MVVQDEEARLHALQQLNLLNTAPSESFDRITRMAGQIFNLGLAAISLTDSDRQWFKSRLGVTDTWMPRHDAPCAEVTDTGGTLIIPDLLTNPRYAQSTLAGTGARFYAGAPLITREGFGLGALCVVGELPRSATTQEIAALSDLASMVMAQIELQHAYGRIDPLSGLPNRTQFLEDLEDMARDAPRHPRLAVLIDLAADSQLSNLARVIGPSYMDRVVKDAVRALQGQLPLGSKAYHIAATQLAFLAPPDTEDEVLLRIEASLTKMQVRSGISFFTTTAMGVTPFLLGEMRPQDVLRTAYSAAQDSRTHERIMSIYSSTIDQAHQRRFLLLHDFATALRDPDQLRLVFQPRIELASGRCAGVEALLRWRHPSFGEVSPAEFIPIIEQTSLVKETTAWVLDNAMRQVAVWQTQKLDLRVSINMSATNLDEADFAERMQFYLHKHRLRAQDIELEMTESAIMNPSGHASKQLEALVEAGFWLAIDDFGTGYSSLSYLQTLPAHVVKIDQSFIRHLTAGSREQALVRAMITLSHDLGYRVVAEGVETEESLRLLIQAGCDEAQGFFFSRPISALELSNWAGQRNADAARSAA